MPHLTVSMSIKNVAESVDEIEPLMPELCGLMGVEKVYREFPSFFTVGFPGNPLGNA